MKRKIREAAEIEERESYEHRMPQTWLDDLAPLGTDWHKPFLTTFSDKDTIMTGGEKVFKKLVPGAAGQDHVIIKDGGHFLQEDKGEEIAGVLIEFIARDT